MRALPGVLRTESHFENWIEPLKRNIQIAVHEVEDQVRAVLDGMARDISGRESCRRTVYEIFKGGKSPTKSASSIRSKIGRTLLEDGVPRRTLSPAQVRRMILRFPDLGRFRIVCALSSDVEEALLALLGAKQKRLARCYPVVVKVKDYVEDLSKRSPSSGHRAKQFAVAVRTGPGAEIVRVEIQLMTTVQHAWDQRNHPIYEWTREGDKLPDHLVIRDVALAETLYLVDQQASQNWRDILDWRKGRLT
jgi:ppGpp synthetase/RelA/SpoT-type nucleotidyltranferase